VSINDSETTLSAHDATVKYLNTLIGFASDFLGRKIDAAVVGVPSNFSKAQLDALEKACKDAAGVQVLQFLNEPAAACLAYGLTSTTSPSTSTPAGASPASQDRNVVVLDVGASSTTATVLAARQGLYVPLATVRDANLGGDNLDQNLVEHFVKEFTKKNKGVKLDIKENHRANMKLRLSCEVVKRSLSASTSATCSVESLVDGIDFSSSVNRSRFDLLSGKVYSQIGDKIREALEQAKLDPLQIHEVILVGGTSKNPTLADRIGAIFPETTLVSSQIEPDQVIARGCVLQAQALSSTSPSSEAIDSKSSLAPQQVKVLTKPIGLLVPAPSSPDNAENPGVVDGKTFVTILESATPLPARRIVSLPVSASSKAVKVLVAEGEEAIHVQAPPATNGKKASNDEDDSEEEDEEEETRTKYVKATTQLAELVVPVTSSGKDSSVQITVIVDKDEKVTITAGQTGGEESSKQTVSL
jgi:molecular chaperone DnaK (HSP70)